MQEDFGSHPRQSRTIAAFLLSRQWRSDLEVSGFYGLVVAGDLGDIIAANIRAERARRRWSQADLAEKLGLGTSTVSAIELGVRRVQVGDLPALCSAFGIGLGKLLDGAEQIELDLLFR